MLETLTGNKNKYLSDWERKFVESVNGQYQKGKESLSKKQLEWLQKFLDKYTDEYVEEEKAWRENFKQDKKMQTDFRLCVNYYYRTGYYKNIVTRYRNVDLAIEVPTPTEYKKLTNNKYAQKILTSFYSEPKYAVGSYIALRANSKGVHGTLITRSGVRLNSRETEPAHNCFLVIANDGDPINAAKGTKRYKIMHLGKNVVLHVEEREIKKYRG
tara:strand:- start:722 stop:1363 length:642 start_codon:yes stop_codon:yes gene_type:complete